MEVIRSAIVAASEQRFDIIVVSEEGDVEFGLPILEDETQRETASTFKQLFSQFSDAQTAVGVRLAEPFCQLTERQQALDLFPTW